MKLLATILFLLIISSCSIFHKSVNQVKQEDHNSSLILKDSLTHVSIDSSSGSGSMQLGTVSVDSSYDKVTEEVIKEVIDSNVIRRETTRTIKERGQKRIEQTSTTLRSDSVSKRVNQNTAVNQLQKKDSGSVIMTTHKDIKRDAFLPWWLWLIVAAVAALAWWQRNPIINFLTGK